MANPTTLGKHNIFYTPQGGLPKCPERQRAPRVGLRRSRLGPASQAEKLAARTTQGPDCWLVAGYQLPNGYVQISRHKQTAVYAHRLAYDELAHGPIPAGLVVMHSCDTPNCVNPNHLSVGTQLENMRDAARKGRMRGPWQRARRMSLAVVFERVPSVRLPIVGEVS